MRRRRRRRRGVIWRFFSRLFEIVLVAAVIFIALMLINPLNVRDRLADALSGRQTAETEETEETAESGQEDEDPLTTWENALNAETQGEKYYYGLLTDQAEQQAYHQIAQGLEAQNDEIRLQILDPDRVNALFEMVLFDYPEYFWCDGSAVTTVFTGLDSYSVLEPGYTYAMDKRSEMQQEINEAAAECLAGISVDATEYRKIQHVYQWIVDTVDYDANASDNQNIYSVFVGKRSVCAGYSKATQYLLERLGVFCTYVTGEATGNEKHAWNMVRIGEDYYYVDTTWGDPVFQTELEGEGQSYISYDYLCCDDTQLFATHTPNPDYALPACTHMEYNYYVINGMYYTYYDPDEISRKMNEVIDEKGNPSVIKFSGRELYEEAHDEIMGELLNKSVQYLARQYGLRMVHYQYLDDEDLNKITIYWQYD